MYAEQDAYPIGGYRIIITDSLYELLSSAYLLTLEHFVNNMGAALDAFCVSVKGQKIDDIDFDTLVLETFQMFYSVLFVTTSDAAAVTARETFTNFLTLNYVMRTAVDDLGTRVEVLQLVMDLAPDVRASPTGQNFLMWRAIHERSLNTLH